MNRRRSLLVLLLGLASLVLAGCAGGPRIGNVPVTVVDLRPRSATLLETEAVITLRYTNENVIPIGIEGSSHKLYLDGRHVGTAVSNEPVGLAPLSTQTQQVTVHLENLALVQQLIRAEGASSISYRLESRLRVATRDDHLDIRGERSGTIDLEAFAGATNTSR